MKKLTEKQIKEYKEDGFIKDFSFDVFDANIIKYFYKETASDGAYNGGVFEIKMRELSGGSIIEITPDEVYVYTEERPSYLVEVMLNSRGFDTNDRTFTSLLDAIDYYNKIYDFIKDVN